jgi:predicted MFS family arabinose efflux permease
MLSITSSIIIFQLLYVVLELVSYLKGPSTSILIAETYERGRRSRAISRQGLIEGIGAVIGLGVCIFLVNTIGYKSLLGFCAPLVFLSFIFALLTISEPPFYIERSFDRMDRIFGNLDDLSYQLNGDGPIAPNRDGKWYFGKSVNMKLFGLGRTLFAFAASNAFTTLTLFLLTRAKFTSSEIFTVYQFRSIVGTFSYLFVGRIAGSDGSGSVLIGTLMRIVLVSSIPLILILPTPVNIIVASIILSLVATSWSIYSVGTEMVTVMYAASGSLGLFDALASLGGALGNYSGGYIPTVYGFENIFMFSAILFALAFILFYLSLKAK